jgi:membrane associated rhomboid family serine protease
MSVAAVVFESAHFAQCSERALVLRTQGIGAEVVPSGGGFALVVNPSDAVNAQREIDSWQRENENWPPRHTPVRHHYLDGWPGVMVYVFVMCLGFALSSAHAGGLNWFGAGKVDAGLVSDGQWWRTVTALTLHADLPHLVSNLVFGSALGYFVGRYFGSGVAWLAILLAGAAGNIVNSLLMPPTHTSVGASTAIFAALGMLSAFAWKRRMYPQDRWAYRLGPIIAGIALLAYTGTGGERTDVSAHLTGFGSGFAAGVGFAIMAAYLPRADKAQWIAGAAALALLAVSWAIALAVGPAARLV